MVRLASPDHPAFPDDLRRLAAAVDAVNGRLTVILPDREVWRDRRRLSARTPWRRHREARDLAAEALEIAPGEVALSVGRRGSDGTTPLAATRRQTLVEVRRMLAAVGLRAEVIRGAGRFDGFATPPALGNLRWNPAGRPLPSRLPPAAAALGGLAASIAAVVTILGAGASEPIMSQGPLVHRSVARGPLTVAEATLLPAVPAKQARAEKVERPAQPVTIARAAPPPTRPEVAAVAPVELPAPAFSMNTRNLDVSADKDGKPVLKLRDLPAARAAALQSSGAPLPRPRIARETAAASAAAKAGIDAASPLDADRPRARPVVETQRVAERAVQPAAEPVAEIVRRVAAADTEDFVRPEHRPAASVRVASLTPADAVVGALAAAAVAPLARPDGFGAGPARPAPKPAPAAAALPVRKPEPAAGPKLQRGATAGAIAARPLAPPAPANLPVVTTPVTARATAPAIAAPTPVRVPVVTAALAPQPKIVPITPTPKITRAVATARTVPVAAVAPQPVRSFTRTSPRVGLSRGQISLIGVFGDTDAPHALVRLPNGDIQRVRSGDNVAGLQVAAVTSDGVRVRSGASETMLRLPD
ncbi:MAG: hypothetical protein QM699_06960 [Amaricoccus sp.]|uniref:hypothetical protein n=1 Tax=Amaricoccus sp. TaxID=1872485 RepID=UPI0039E2DCB1